jgi:cytoplasmic iron level regulating protein YaaA (DUF328/UPF0246 family)
MLTLISPSKNLDEKSGHKITLESIPEFLTESEKLIKALKKYSVPQLVELMDINPKLAKLNADRYNKFCVPHTSENSKTAILLFSGEVYNGLQAKTLNQKDLEYSHQHLRILSGLYGLIRPLDMIQPYRLEMGIKLKVGKKNDLYTFWGDKITQSVNRELSNHKEKVLLNLASNEYYSVINPTKIKARIVSCTFKEERNGKYQFITIYGKKARGLMTRFIIKNRIDKAEDLKHFDEEGYYFNERISKKDNWVFVR